MEQIIKKNSNDIEESQTKSFSSRIKCYIFWRSNLLSTCLNVKLYFAVLLMFIYQLQVIAALTILILPRYDLQHHDLANLDFYITIFKFMLLKFNNVELQLVSLICMLAVYIICMMAYLLPISSEQINYFTSNYLITILTNLLIIPSLLLSSSNIADSKMICLALPLLIIVLSSHLLINSIHFKFSFENNSKNILVRNPKGITDHLLEYILIILLPWCLNLAYPVLVILNMLCILAISLIKIKQQCIKFCYHHQVIPKIQGILILLKCSVCFCYLIVLIFKVALVKNSIVIFILAFFVFSTNFFLIFRNYILKKVIIDSNILSSTDNIIFILWYLNCLRNIKQKKNQLYITSLLKNHCNQCLEPTCYCKIRQQLYDPSTDSFGKPSWQPHKDKVFAKYFFLKFLQISIKQYPKSIILKLMLSFYFLQTLNLIPHTLKLINILNKQALKLNLSFSEEYLLFCLRQKTSIKMNEINIKKGNFNIEKLIEFDGLIIKLKQSLLNCVRYFLTLWKNMHQNNTFNIQLINICRNALQATFQIEKDYQKIKNISSSSSELKGLMLIYSRFVVHDIHLQSQINKQISNNQWRSITCLSEIHNIQLFSAKTITIIVHHFNRIKWCSKNSAQLLGYHKKQDVLKLSINQLMPLHFANQHDQYIKRWQRTGEGNKLNRTSYLWGITKNGICFSMIAYIKMIYMVHQHSYVLMCSFEKIDDQNEIITNQFGQILGCGKVFMDILQCPSKIIQQNIPNIQVMIPKIFPLFMPNFIKDYSNSHENDKIITQKCTKIIDIQSAVGFFPDCIMNNLIELNRNKNLLEKNKQSLQNNLKLLQQKMQQWSIKLKGLYLQFNFNVQSLYFQKKPQSLIYIFKINKVNQIKIEKYYFQLQNTVQNIIKKNAQKKKENITNYRKSSNFLNLFLNSKLTGQYNSNILRILSSNNNHQSIMKIKLKLSYNKKINQYQQHKFINDQVRYNVWRIKKVLHDNKIISLQTYKLIGGEKYQKQQFDNYKYKIQDRVESQEDKLSQDSILENKKIVDSKHQNKTEHSTFNSGTSSAAFISLKGSIRQFKNKLKSLNTPKSLYWFNILLITVVSIEIFTIIWQNIDLKKKLQLSTIHFQQTEQASTLLDALINCRITLNNEQIYPNSIYYPIYRSYYRNMVQNTFLKHLKQVQKYHQISPPLLQYLNYYYQEKKQKNIQQFILEELNFLHDNIHKNRYNDYKRIIQTYKVNFKNNPFYNEISSYILYQFIFLICLMIFLKILTVPILWKLCRKSKEIIRLLQKISQKDKIKYYYHFLQLKIQLKTAESNKEIDNVFDSIGIKKINFSKQNVGHSRSIISNKKQNNLNSFNIKDYYWYCQIFFIYLFIISVLSIQFSLINQKLNSLIQKQQNYHSIFDYKLQYTERMLLFNQFIQNPILNQFYYNNFKVKEILIVNSIYDSYHMTTNSEFYKNFIQKFTFGDTCKEIQQPYLKQIDDSNLQLLKNQCKSVIKGGFLNGALNNFYYIQRKKQQIMEQLWKGKKLQSQQINELELAYHHSNLMINSLSLIMVKELNESNSYFIFQIMVINGIYIITLVIFYFMWYFIYRNISQLSSYTNAFLLLIPFNLLNQNTYIKLYIKQQFELKLTSNY